MFKIIGIDHLVLRTDDPQQLMRFYIDVLGCHLERQLDPDVGLFQLRAGNALIDIVPVDSELGRKGGGAPTAKNNNLDHLCLQIDTKNLDDVLQHLEQHQVQIGEVAERYGATGFGLSVYIYDPDNNMVELKPVDISAVN
jgi:glyoxylase I family protein